MNNQNKTNWSFWSIVIIILIVLVMGVVLLAKSSGNNSGTIPPQEIMNIQDDDNIKGNKEAGVVIIEYSDFQCPFCKIYSFHSRKIAEEFGDEVVVIFRYFPLESIHPHAKLASQAAEAAGLQGKFWEMHDVIFERQEEWSESTDAFGLFKQYAEKLELDLEKFTTDIYSGAVKDRVERDLASALEIGLNSTPSFIINGEQINTPSSYDKFRKTVQSYFVEGE